MVLNTCTYPCQRLYNHPFMIKRASRSFQDIQENFFEENLTNIPGRGRKKKSITSEVTNFGGQCSDIILKAALQRYRRLGGWRGWGGEKVEIPLMLYTSRSRIWNITYVLVFCPAEKFGLYSDRSKQKKQEWHEALNANLARQLV